MTDDADATSRPVVTAGVLVVDAANVVGSRPDGWWRDRLGAATRLVRRLDAYARAHPDLTVVVVVEGRAREVDPAVAPALRVVAAPGSGDDAVVDVVDGLADRAGDCVVVTSDRELARRVAERGASVHGASWLLDTLDAEARG